jgi:hypothetical protein
LRCVGEQPIFSHLPDALSNLQEHERRPALFAFNPEPDAKKTDLIQGESKHGKNIDNGNHSRLPCSLKRRFRSP